MLANCIPNCIPGTIVYLKCGVVIDSIYIITFFEHILYINDNVSVEEKYKDGERLEYRMLIGKVNREIVQSLQNWMKRSTWGDFCRRYFDYGSKFRE